tara:strand:- start:436 stop:561 length:126 start_codon:yes stop_codon:yes gene_type:complete
MLGKNKDNYEYNYTQYNDNKDAAFIYIGYILLGIFLLAILV